MVKVKIERNSPRTPRKEDVTMGKKNPNLSILPNWQQRLQPSCLTDTPSFRVGGCLLCFSLCDRHRSHGPLKL